MSNFNKMIQNVSIKYHDKIKKFCQPLTNHFDVSNFTYTKVTNSGQFYSLFSHVKWMEYYFSEKLYLRQPHLRHPSNFYEGISFAKQIENKEYQDIALIAYKKFNVNFGMGIINKVDDGFILIGFDSNTSNPIHDTLFLNEIVLLQRFASYFVAENQFMFEELESYKVDMAQILGKKFNDNSIPVIKKLGRRENFLKEIGIETDVSLSLKNKKILKQLIKGYSAKQIANTFNLSPRTIEHSIEQIKNKLSCFSKTELIQKARELELFGCLN